MNLSGCDKVVLKNSISGSRFIVSPHWCVKSVFCAFLMWLRLAFLFQNLSDHDLQKFPKLHAPWVLICRCWVTVRGFCSLSKCELCLVAFHVSIWLISLLQTSEPVWLSLCVSVPGWFPRSALRSVRRTRKEGCSVGSMFQKVRLCQKYDLRVSGSHGNFAFFSLQSYPQISRTRFELGFILESSGSTVDYP